MSDHGGSPGDLLLREAKKFAGKRFSEAIRSATDRVADFGDRLDEAADEGGGAVTDTLREAGKALIPAGSGKVGQLASAATGLMSRSKGGSQPRRGTSIIEEIDLGVPVDVAYNQWTQFTEFPEFAKGVQKVEQTDDHKVRWEGKVFLSRRQWTSEITEQLPDKRIAWTSQGPKGTVDGVVTFHELAPELTKLLLALEYHPKGPFEHVGNLWRAQGRRVRLDLKRFRSFVMQRGEETGAWRGEIHDGEVTPEGELEQSPAGGEDHGSTEEQGAGKDDGRRARGPARSPEREQSRRDRAGRRERRGEPAEDTGTGQRNKRSNEGSGSANGDSASDEQSGVQGGEGRTRGRRRGSRQSSPDEAYPKEGNARGSSARSRTSRSDRRAD